MQGKIHQIIILDETVKRRNVRRLRTPPSGAPFARMSHNIEITANTHTLLPPNECRRAEKEAHNLCFAPSSQGAYTLAKENSSPDAMKRP
jgi:hypothetical protein